MPEDNEHLQSHLSRHGVLWWAKRSHPGLKEEDRRNRALSEDQTPAGPHESRSAWWIYSCWGSKYWVRIVLSILDDIVYIYTYVYCTHVDIPISRWFEPCWPPLFGSTPNSWCFPWHFVAATGVRPARRKSLRELRLLRHLERGIIDVMWHLDVAHDTS